MGRILRDSGVPTIEFRGSVIIGSGSLSFEMVRALVETLPIMITPKWVLTPTQPIAVEDVVEYLASAAELLFEESAIFEIGGPDRVSYLDLLREMRGNAVFSDCLFLCRYFLLGFLACGSGL